MKNETNRFFKIVFVASAIYLFLPKSLIEFMATYQAMPKEFNICMTGLLILSASMLWVDYIESKMERLKLWRKFMAGVVKALFRIK